jgi:molecular chaperone DnaK
MVDVEIPFIAADNDGPLNLKTVLARDEFEEMINGAVERTLRLTSSALRDAGMRPENVDRVLLVGGSTRIPLVQGRIEELFGKPPERSMSPDEVVAAGAAVQGAILSGGVGQTALVDVTPLGLGVEADGGTMVTMIERNSVIPAQAQAVFTTVADYQKAVTIKILQGERPLSKDNTPVGSFRLEGIRNARQGEPQILVTFDIDVNGLVHVSAEDQDTGVSCRVSVDALSGLTEEQVAAVLADSRASELDDIGVRADRRTTHELS